MLANFTYLLFTHILIHLLSTCPIDYVALQLLIHNVAMPALTSHEQTLNHHSIGLQLDSHIQRSKHPVDYLSAHLLQSPQNACVILVMNDTLPWKPGMWKFLATSPAGSAHRTRPAGYLHSNARHVYQ